MHKFVGMLTLACVALAFVLGAAFIKTASQPTPAQLAADADKAAAAAARDWVGVELARVTLAQTAGMLAVAGYGAAGAFAVLAMGGALVAVSWGRRRVSVIYPRGGVWPVLVEHQRDGSIVALDLSRGIGPVTIITEDGVIIGQDQTETTGLQLATTVHQAAALVAAASPEQGHQVHQLATDKLAATVPLFATDQGEGLRLVHVKGGPATQAQRDLCDLRELIERAPIVGLARRTWVGITLKSGHRCTRGRYDALMGKLKGAGVTAEEGQGVRLAVTVAEALDAFNIGKLDEAEEMAETVV